MIKSRFYIWMVKNGDNVKKEKYLLMEFFDVDLIHSSGINFHILLNEID